MRRIYQYLPVVAMLPCLAGYLGAQSFDANIGFGTGHSMAGGNGIDSGDSTTPFTACSTSAGDTFCQSTPSLDGLFMNLGGDYMFNKHLGVGFGYNFQPSKSDYGPLRYRQSFVDGNVLYDPARGKRWALQLQGGVGSARTGFSFAQTACVGTAVCTDSVQAVGTANHFQVHAGAGIEFLLHDHIFFRPEFDLHYVPNFTDQFGNNTVPMVMFNIGYTSRSKD